ncbi:methyl-accepting chemotaxis protein [Leptospira sp. 'Mane']|uniref:methyl-accepting chemotaxis protein n=1 Tax=Leptospira sp. 'Mane' TaxID=3387407 RepID=UPI00398A8404
MFKKLSIKIRLFLLPIPLILPILFLFISLFWEQNKSIDFSEKEIEGLKSTKEIYQIFENLILLQTEPDKYTKQELADNPEKLLAGKNINELALRLDKTGNEKSDPISLITEIRNLQSKVGDDSNLILDPDIDSYYFMDIIIIRFPSIFESIAQINTEISKSSKNPSFNQTKLETELISIKKEIREIKKSIVKVKEFNPKFFEENNSESQAEIEKMEKQFLEFETEISNPSFLKTNIKGIQWNHFPHLKSLSRKTLDSLEKLINIRVNKFKSQQNFSIVAILIIVLLAIVFLLTILKSILNPLSLIVSKVEELSSEEANLTHELPDMGKNELSILSHSINKFLKNLTDIIQKLRKSSDDANTASDRLHKDAQSVSESATNLASTTEESSSALEQLSRSFDLMLHSIISETKNINEIEKEMQSIKKFLDAVSNSLIELDTIVIESNKVAQEGDATVKFTESSMKEIQEATVQISGIVKLITDISEQTNLLALNASIEAARAGDAGKGFAVVAEEISKLANKTRSSVNGIRGLIEKTNLSVNSGSNHVSQTVTALSHIVENSLAIKNKVNHLQIEMSEQVKSVTLVTTELNGLKDMAEMIEYSSKEQKQASEEMQVVINELAKRAELLADNSEDLNIVSRQITDVSATIAAITARFKIK